MATVVITFIFKASFYVFKMDADFKEKQGLRVSSQREKRWSMNSQRLEEIVAELMKPIGDLRRSFDTDLSALLEEYLTEAGLRALASPGQPAVPNFPELALLLQHSASAYSRKVDCLYQHVLSVSDSLQQANIEMANSAEAESEARGGEAPPGAGGRRKRAPALEGFGPIALSAAPGALRPPGAARPPPTLPRAYTELAPRPLAPGDAPLLDHAGEPIGLLADYHSCWALRQGLLCDELQQPGLDSPARCVPIPLNELQEAISSRAPPLPPPPLACSSPLPLPPSRSPSPAPPPPVPLAPMLPPPPPPPSKAVKRKADCAPPELASRIKLTVTKEMVLGGGMEFSVPLSWLQTVVSRRSLAVVTLRRELRRQRLRPLAGFDYCNQDTTGFSGWSEAEALSASSVLARLPPAGHTDSDDDGFFEQSSSGESDSCPLQLTANSMESLTASGGGAEEWGGWQAAVERRADEAKARGGLDVAKLAERLLAALPDPGTAGTGPADPGPTSPGPAAAGAQSPAPARSFQHVLRDTADHPTDVSRLFLTTLFLANSGNVEVISGGPLTINTCSLRLVTRDAALYSAAVAEPLLAVTIPSAPTAPKRPRPRPHR